jgi:hypothetical protein
VLNDVTVGTYDVVMDTGPGYDTRRQEGVAAMMELLNTPLGEKVAQSSDDLIVRNMDFPGSDAIADRLAAANTLWPRSTKRAKSRRRRRCSSRACRRSLSKQAR